jgi:hypothetical protein
LGTIDGVAAEEGEMRKDDQEEDEDEDAGPRRGEHRFL